MSEITTVHLTNESGNNISPFTPASSVYYVYGEEGNKKMVNMETKLGSIDIGRIDTAHEEAIDSIMTLSADSVQYIEDNRDSYENDIEALSGITQRLYDKEFPFVLTQTITPTLTGTTWSYNFRYNGTEESKPVSGATTTVKHFHYNNGAETLVQTYTSTNATETYSNIPLGYGYDKWTTNCVRGTTKSGSVAETRYLCFYAANNKAEITGSDLSGMTKTYTTNFTSATVSTVLNSRPYVWLVVPKPTKITNAKASGVEFSLREAVEVVVDGVPYNAYRSNVELGTVTWNITFTHSKS